MLNKNLAFTNGGKTAKTHEITVQYFSSWSSGTSYGFGYDYRPVGSEPLMGELVPRTFDKYELSGLYADANFSDWALYAEFKNASAQGGAPTIEVTRLDTGESMILNSDDSNTAMSEWVKLENYDYSKMFFAEKDVGKTIPLNIRVVSG